MKRATKNLTAVTLILCVYLVSAALAGEVTDKKKVSLVYLGLPPGTAIYTIAIAQSQVPFSPHESGGKRATRPWFTGHARTAGVRRCSNC